MKEFRPTFTKKLKSSDGSVFDLPANIKVKGGNKNGFYLVHNGDIFTPKLNSIIVDDNQIVVSASTTHGLFVKVDLKLGKFSTPYTKELGAKNSTIYLTPDDNFVVFDTGLNAIQTGYTKVANIEDNGEVYYIFKKGSAKPENEKYGIISSDGVIVCPPIFYTDKLEVNKKDGMFFLISSPSVNSKQVLTKSAGISGDVAGNVIKINKVMLKADKITQIGSFQASYNNGNNPFYASYDKQTNQSEVFCYDRTKYAFNSLGKIQGMVFDAVEEPVYKKFYYQVETAEGTKKFVSIDGTVDFVADEIENVKSVCYLGYDRSIGNMKLPPIGISIHSTTEVPYVIYNDDKMGLFDATLGKVMLAPNYNKILIATKTEDGQRRFLVENTKKHFGVVDGTGKSVVPFTLTSFDGISEIKFDQGKRFVAKMGIESRTGKKYVFIDPANESGYASELEIDRYFEDQKQYIVDRQERERE